MNPYHIEAHLDHLDEVIYDEQVTTQWRWYLEDDLSVTLANKVNGESVESSHLWCGRCHLVLADTKVRDER